MTDKPKDTPQPVSDESLDAVAAGKLASGAIIGLTKAPVPKPGTKPGVNGIANGGDTMSDY